MKKIIIIQEIDVPNIKNMPQGNQNAIIIEPIFMEGNELNQNNELENHNT